MKMGIFKVFVVLLLVAVVASKKVGYIESRAHHKKSEKKHFPKYEEEDDLLNFLHEDEKDELKKPHKLDEFDSSRGGYAEDPCAKHKCGPGKHCEIDENGIAQCACVTKCPTDGDLSRRVCSNHNETWQNDCELYRMRCLCVEDLDGCKDDIYRHVHIDYNGPCKELGVCTPDEMSDFPRRMREWFFVVMQDMARRQQLRGQALRMEKEAEEAAGDRKWVNAVIWRFCELDVHPRDRQVSRHELFPIRGPLMTMEHCIAPFLDNCDADDDHKITLQEWGHCLGLKDDEIKDKCASLNRG